MTDRELMFDIIRYLEFRNQSLEDGYEWREINGLILQIKNNFNISHSEHERIFYEVNPIPTNIKNKNLTNLFE